MTEEISRRKFVLAGAGVLAGFLLPAPQVLAAARGRPRELSLVNLHTGEKVKRAVYWENGRYDYSALHEISHLLRDHRSGERFTIDRRLLDTLYTLHRQMDSAEPFHVISGYRSPQTNEMLRQQGHGVAKRSYHMQGRAVDIQLPGAQIATLHKAAMSLKTGGVGYYPDSGFIHLDTGPVRTW